jgi:hypothetical protein
MATILHCPEPKCRHKVRVPDTLLGKRVRCPLCGNKFTAPTRTDPDEEELPPPAVRRRAEKKPIASKRNPPPPAEEEEEEKPPPPAARRRRAEENRIVAKRDPAPPAKADEEEEPPRKRRHKGKRRRRDEDEEEAEGGVPSPEEAGWKKVATGLFLCILSLWSTVGMFALIVVGILSIGGIVAVMASSMKPAPAPGPGFGEGAPAPGPGLGPASATPGPGLGAGTALAGIGGTVVLVFVGLNVLAVAATVLKLVGLGLCIALPKTRQGNLHSIAMLTFGLTISAWGIQVLCQVIAIVQNGFLGSIGALIPLGGGGNPFIGLLVEVLEFAAWINWFRLLRGIALEAREEDLYSRIGLFLAACVGLVCISCLFMPCSMFVLVTSADKGSGGAWFVGIVGILILLVALGLGVWYMVLLYQVKGCALKLMRRAAKAGLRGR